MQTNLQPNLFDLLTTPTATATTTAFQPVIATTKPMEATAPTFFSPAQREMMQRSGYAFYFRGKTIPQIEKIHEKMSGEFYRKSRQSEEGERNLSEWYRTMWSAQTIALEEAYRKVDARFLEPQKGEFWLTGKTRIKVSYTYQPCSSFESLERLTVPAPHFEFRCDQRSEISETGYRSHYLLFIPYDSVKSMEDLLEQIVSSHFKAKSVVSFAL